MNIDELRSSWNIFYIARDRWYYTSLGLMYTYVRVYTHRYLYRCARSTGNERWIGLMEINMQISVCLYTKKNIRVASMRNAFCCSTRIDFALHYYNISYTRVSITYIVRPQRIIIIVTVGGLLFYILPTELLVDFREVDRRIVLRRCSDWPRTARNNAFHPIIHDTSYIMHTGGVLLKVIAVD